MIKKRLKAFFESIGIITIKEHPLPFDYNYNDYDLSQESQREKIQVHKDFLISVLQEENNRLNYVENKTTQIISQTSIVFSLVGLVLPIVIDRFDNIYLSIKIVLILLMIAGFFMYLLSIRNALKNFNIKKFQYPYSDPANVINLKNNSIDEFNSELIRDYLFSINKTIQINNIKGTNLLHSYRAFKIANYFTGLIISGICFLILFTKKEDNISRVQIEKPIVIKQYDKQVNRKNKSIILSDTIENKISTNKD